jgi:hypothetical protein
MKYTIRNTTVLAALIVGSWAASLAATVNVPFAFQAGGVEFPAGQYEVKASSNHAFLTLQSKQYPAKQYTWVAHPADPNPQADAVLSFDETGSVPVLLSIQNLQWRTNNFSVSHKKSSDIEQASLGK